MRVAILGMGEAGMLYAKAFAAVGCDVRGYDPRDVAVAAGMHKSASIAEAVSGADLVLGLTTAGPSVSVAREAAEALGEGSLFIDMNAASPEHKRKVGKALGQGAKMVDGAVIGSVPRFGARVHVLLSGEHSDEAAQKLQVIGAEAESMLGEVGDASGRKLLRSVFMKGLGALITEAMAAGEQAGESQWMKLQIAGELALGDSAVDRLWEGTKTHSYRRAMELGASLDLLTADGNRSWPMTQAAQEVHLAGVQGRTQSLADELAAIPTSAIGDGGDRLGILDSSVKPVWSCPPIAGRAFTVYTRPGDNQALHEALPLAMPGDVLVIAGGGYTERALMGELIAERAQKLGIAGMVIDGAVRDVDALAELEFPVWASGISPAGPYKSGPGRLCGTIAVAGVACRHGDFIVADADGVIVIPAATAEREIAAGRAVVADELQRQELIRASSTPS